MYRRFCLYSLLYIYLIINYISCFPNKPKTTNHNHSFNREKQESIVSNFELNPIIANRLSSFNSITNDKIFTLNTEKINYNGYNVIDKDDGIDKFNKITMHCLRSDRNKIIKQT